MININLLPPELKLQRINAKRNASLISICIIVVFIFVIIGVIVRSLASTVEARLTTAKNDVQRGSSQLDQYKNLEELALLINDRSNTADKISQNRLIWSQALQELTNSAPSDVQFENLTANVEKTPNFVLKGNTTTEREIIKFKEKLENSPMFKNVSFKSSSLTKETNPPTGGQEGEKLSFTLDFEIEQKSLSQTVSGTNVQSPSGKQIK